MAKPEHVYIRGFWDRLEEEIYKKGISKAELAKRCRFERKVLYEKRSMYLPYFARVCAELHVSADYILFGEKR